MAGVMEMVDLRTRLAGHNRLELLMFYLGGKQHYGINVFKVQEVIQCPTLTKVPHSHPVVRGIASMRGRTISIMDLSMAIGMEPWTDTENSYVIISEYNRSTQGFLVSGVDRIINIEWSDVLPPPKGQSSGYMTAVTNVDDHLVEIIDVEKILVEVIGQPMELGEKTIESGKQENFVNNHILVVDDSSVARKQIKRTLTKIDIECTVANNGQEALDILKAWADEDVPVSERIDMVISDVEMPQMDGYTLTTEIRKDPRLQNLYVLLHTSLSGVFNQSMIERVGANEFVAKFDAETLAKAVINHSKLTQEKVPAEQA